MASARVVGAAKSLDARVKAIIQAVPYCFLELREHELGTVGHPITGDRWTLVYWMDLTVRHPHAIPRRGLRARALSCAARVHLPVQDLIQSELNIQMLDVPEWAVIYYLICQADDAPLKDEKHTYHGQRSSFLRGQPTSSGMTSYMISKCAARS